MKSETSRLHFVIVVDKQGVVRISGITSRDQMVNSGVVHAEGGLTMLAASTTLTCGRDSVETSAKMGPANSGQTKALYRRTAYFRWISSMDMLSRLV